MSKNHGQKLPGKTAVITGGAAGMTEMVMRFTRHDKKAQVAVSIRR